jgi:hypothetical protein
MERTLRDLPNTYEVVYFGGVQMDKYIRVTFSDGRSFDIPASIIAEKRAVYYVDEDILRGRTTIDDRIAEINREIAYALLDTFELLDYLAGSMDWQEVQPYATEVETPPPPAVCYEHEWSNAHREVIAY